MSTEKIAVALEHLLDPLDLTETPSATSPGEADLPGAANDHPAEERQAGGDVVDDKARLEAAIPELLFENERVRLFEVTLQPGEQTDLRSRPAGLVYALSEGTCAVTKPSGDRTDLAMSPGAVFWMDAAERATGNVGSTPIRAIVFEPKERPR